MIMKDEVCQDMLKRLEETKQIYIVGLDVPISITKGLFSLLDKKRREIARQKSIPEEQFDFEDLIGYFLGITDPRDEKLPTSKPAERIATEDERVRDILRRAGYGVGSPTERTEEEWDKKRCTFCATELASVIGRMGEWELRLERDDWGEIDDELPILEDEINMVGDACDLDVQEALKDYEELKESVRNRDKRGVLAAMGKIEADTFYKLAKIAVKPRR